MKKIILLLILMIAFYTCDEESSPVKVGTNPNIEEIRLKSKWNSASTKLTKVEVKITDPQGFNNIRGVFLEVRNQSNSQVVFSDSLYDDGALLHAQDGDVLAGDGFFSNRFSAVQIANSVDGTYVFSFRAFDTENNESNILEESALFGPNARPEIVEVDAPDTLFSGTKGQVIEVAVTDADGVADIDRAYYDVTIDSTTVIDTWDLFNDGDFSNNGDLFADDSIYTIKLDSSFAVDKKGMFYFNYHVEDSFTEDNLQVPILPIYIENEAGTIIYTDVPDSINRPTSSYNRKLMTLKVYEPQGLLDIDSVYFYSVKPNGDTSNLGNPILLRDNGLPFDINDPGMKVGDEIPNDGIFSFSLLSFPGDSLGTYKFSFYIRDLANNLSDVVKDSIVIY